MSRNLHDMSSLIALYNPGIGSSLSPCYFILPTTQRLSAFTMNMVAFSFVPIIKSTAPGMRPQGLKIGALLLCVGASGTPYSPTQRTTSATMFRQAKEAVALNEEVMLPTSTRPAAAAVAEAVGQGFTTCPYRTVPY